MTRPASRSAGRRCSPPRRRPSIPRGSRPRLPVTPGGARRSPDDDWRKALLPHRFPGRFGSAPESRIRPVTPEVAGSSPVAPVKVPANRHVVLSVWTPDRTRLHRLFAARPNTRENGPKPVPRVVISSHFRPWADRSRRRPATTQNGRRSRGNLCERGSLAADFRGLERAAALSARSLNDLLERLRDHAAAFEDAGSLVAVEGRLDAAHDLLEEALRRYEQLGAVRDSARTLASMRKLGIGRKRRGARKRPPTGWDALTPSEVEVVRFAAERLTNPQIGQRLFISRRRVQTHLAHAFRKIDIASRVELAAEAARRGGV
jgi:DNA-binding CsgD family transcriptional regulator